MTSLHPPSFHRNDFSTCSTHFSFGVKPQFFLRHDDDDDEEYDDTKIEKSRMSGFSRGKLEAGRNELGLCTARYESRSCC